MDKSGPASDRPRGILGAVISLRPGEGSAVVLSALYFFFVLLSYYMQRPARETMGIKRDFEDLPWLMTGTLAAMALVNPLYSLLVSKYPRRIFIPATYRFFAVNMLVFMTLFYVLPKEWEIGLGYAYYIWLSVFNLFVVSVFWGLNADVFDREQAKRLFGMIAIGGTIGAITGASITGWVVQSSDSLLAWVAQQLGSTEKISAVPLLLLIAIVPLELAVQCVKALLRRQERAQALVVADSRVVAAGDKVAKSVEPGPGMWKGLQLIARSPMLISIAVYMLLYTVTSTFLYMQQGQIVSATFTEEKDRIAAFAQLDQWTNIFTLATQLFLTSQIMRVLGVGGTLCVLPVVTIAGFAALWANPSFEVFKWFQVARRGLHYAVDRPARESLYTLMGPDEKYKSKSFIDTFVYRAGDMFGGWIPKWVKPLGIAIAWLAVPLSVIWLGVAVVLGVLQKRKAASVNAKAE
jgi:AAA family ATP:ADP antiporter